MYFPKSGSSDAPFINTLGWFKNAEPSQTIYFDQTHTNSIGFRKKKISDFLIIEIGVRLALPLSVQSFAILESWFLGTLEPQANFFVQNT